jgi:hypothetical protein
MFISMQNRNLYIISILGVIRISYESLLKKEAISPENTIFSKINICIKGALIPVSQTGCSPPSFIKGSFL